MSLSACLAHLSLQGYGRLTAGFGSQVTHRHTSPDPLFLEPEDGNKVTTHSDTLCFPAVAIMALRRSVLQGDDIFCVIWGYTF